MDKFHLYHRGAIQGAAADIVWMRLTVAEARTRNGAAHILPGHVTYHTMLPTIPNVPGHEEEMNCRLRQEWELLLGSTDHTQICGIHSCIV